MSELYLPFCLAKEVMNNHRFGREYGRPASALNHNMHDYYRRRTRKSASFAVVDDQLILKLDVSALYARNNLRGRDCALECLERTFLHQCGGPREFWPSGIDKIYCTHACGACGTEMHIILNSGYDAKYGEVRNTAWRNLVLQTG